MCVCEKERLEEDAGRKKCKIDNTNINTDVNVKTSTYKNINI